MTDTDKQRYNQAFVMITVGLCRGVGLLTYLQMQIKVALTLSNPVNGCLTPKTKFVSVL